MGFNLQIDVLQEEGRVPVKVFRLKGEISTANYEQLKERVNEEYEKGMRHLLLDFSDITYMSSAGLRAIHTIYRLLEGEESPKDGFKSNYLKLLNLPNTIHQAVKMVGFDRYVEILTTTREDAIKSF